MDRNEVIECMARGCAVRTDGICWESNDMGEPSVKPTHWKEPTHDPR